jgi:hypothetical protein
MILFNRRRWTPIHADENPVRHFCLAVNQGAARLLAAGRPETEIVHDVICVHLCSSAADFYGFGYLRLIS